VEDGLRIGIRTRGALEGRFVVQGIAGPTDPTTFETDSRHRSIALSHPHATIKGAWTAGSAGEIVEGRAVVLRVDQHTNRTRGDDDVVIHLMAADASLTAIQDGDDIIGWLTEGGRTQTLDDLHIDRDEEETTLRSEKHALLARLVPRSGPLQRTEFASAFGPERWIAETIGGPLSRQMWGCHTQLQLGQRALPARVLVLDGYGRSTKTGLGPNR